jgi:hypothetical protein
MTAMHGRAAPARRGSAATQRDQVMSTGWPVGAATRMILLVGSGSSCGYPGECDVGRPDRIAARGAEHGRRGLREVTEGVTMSG